MLLILVLYKSLFISCTMALSVARIRFAGCLSRVILSQSSAYLTGRVNQNVSARNASYMDVDDIVTGLTDEQKQVSLYHDKHVI